MDYGESQRLQFEIIVMKIPFCVSIFLIHIVQSLFFEAELLLASWSFASPWLKNVKRHKNRDHMISTLFMILYFLN